MALSLDTYERYQRRYGRDVPGAQCARSTWPGTTR